MKPINYPKLSTTDLGIFRIGGPGLANCMFLAAKAYVSKLKNGGYFVSPTWTKFSIGPYLRHERDKRAYTRLFKSEGITGLSKLVFLLLHKIRLVPVIQFDSLDDYFLSLAPYQKEIKQYFQSIITPEAIQKLGNKNLSDFIAIHVRLGDYPEDYRIPMAWFDGIIKNILKEIPEQKFILFSDSNDDELKMLTSKPNVSRAFFGNAIADMVAISKCKMLIASDSTFSAWGAFLGNVPIIFNRRHFPPVYNDSTREFVLGNDCSLSETVKRIIK